MSKPHWAVLGFTIGGMRDGGSPTGPTSCHWNGVKGTVVSKKTDASWVFGRCSHGGQDHSFTLTAFQKMNLLIWQQKQDPDDSGESRFGIDRMKTLWNYTWRHSFKNSDSTFASTFKFLSTNSSYYAFGIYLQHKMKCLDRHRQLPLSLPASLLKASGQSSFAGPCTA